MASHLLVSRFHSCNVSMTPHSSKFLWMANPAIHPPLFFHHHQGSQEKLKFLLTASREQLRRTGLAVQELGTPLSLRRNITILATAMREGRIPDREALPVAGQIAAATRAVWDTVESVIVIGGDTAGAIIGDETVETLGCVAAGIPVSRYRQKLVVTKGGGIGLPDTITDLVT